MTLLGRIEAKSSFRVTRTHITHTACGGLAGETGSKMTELGFSTAVFIHKAIASVVLFAAFLCVLIGLYGTIVKRNHIVIRSRGACSIIVTGIVLLMWMVIQMSRIWEVLVPCVFAFGLIQVFIAIISTIIIYRTYSILHAVTVQLKAQKAIRYLAMTRPGRDKNPLQDSQINDPTRSQNSPIITGQVASLKMETKELKEEEVDIEEAMEDTEDDNCCMRNNYLLNQKYRLLYSFLQFLIIVGIFVANPNNYETRSLVSCYPDSSFHAGVFLLILFGVIVIGFRSLEIQDLFHQIEEIAGCAAAIVLTLILAGITLAIESEFDSQTIRDIQIDVAVLQQLSLAIVIVLMPALWATEEHCNLSEKILKPPLLNVLTHRATLQKFREHLIKEWAVENLLFYEDVTKLQIKAAKLAPPRIIIKIAQIYDKYLSNGAKFEVNLSEYNVKPIHIFYKKNQLSVIVRQARQRKFMASKSLTLDFIANIQMVHKRNLSQGRMIDGKMAELVEEGSNLLARAKAEVFHLLDNDSYSRFLLSEGIQAHILDNKVFLLEELGKDKDYKDDRRTRRRSTGTGTNVSSVVVSSNLAL